MKMIYPKSYAHCVEIYKNVRNAARGKNLGTKSSRLYKEGDDYHYRYGGWSQPVSEPPDKYYILTFKPDGTAVVRTPLRYDTKDGFYVGHLFRHIEKGIFRFSPSFEKNMDTPGWMLFDHPIFEGFTFQVNNMHVKTPRVEHIEAEIQTLATEYKDINRKLVKQIKLYNRFDAFEEASSFFNSNSNSWESKAKARDSIQYETMDPQNIEQLAMFLAARKSFSVYGVTNAHMIGTWSNRKYDYEKLASKLLREGAMQALAKIRDEKYREWYNTGKPNNP